MAVIIDCSEKRKNSKGQLVKTVCKNYHSRKHKKQRNKYNTALKKYQNHKIFLILNSISFLFFCVFMLIC